MLSLATSRSKKPNAQPPDPNIRLGLGETAARRSFFFAFVIFANVCFWPYSAAPVVRLRVGYEGHYCRAYSLQARRFVTHLCR
jgi:hypothetical protein